jgi:hypothetical protein
MRAACRLVPLLLAAHILGAAWPPAIDCTAVPGFTQEGKVRSFVPDTLFEYMNGNAEGYLLYEFRRMTGVTCRSGEDSILIDISEMASPEMAYGIFSANRHPNYEVIKIGAAGQIMERRATFVKGSYYVELAASPEKDHRKTLEAFARRLEAQLPGATEPPAALGWFPRDELEADSVRMVPQSVLGLRLLRRGYVANYAFGRAFLVPEESPEAAAALLAKLKARWGEAAPLEVAEEAYAGTDRMLGRMCAARKGRYLFGWAGLKEGEDAAGRLSLLAGHIQ